MFPFIHPPEAHSKLYHVLAQHSRKRTGCTAADGEEGHSRQAAQAASTRQPGMQRPQQVAGHVGGRPAPQQQQHAQAKRRFYHAWRTAGPPSHNAILPQGLERLQSSRCWRQQHRSSGRLQDCLIAGSSSEGGPTSAPWAAAAAFPRAKALLLSLALCAKLAGEQSRSACLLSWAASALSAACLRRTLCTWESDRRGHLRTA